MKVFARSDKMAGIIRYHLPEFIKAENYHCLLDKILFAINGLGRPISSSQHEIDSWNNNENSMQQRDTYSR